MSEKVTLIKFKKEDAGFIQENFPGYFKNPTLEFIETWIESWEEGLGYCIVCGNEKVGMITLGKKEENKLSWGVMVKEEYRGQGIAPKAFELIKNKAKEKGYSKIISSCSADNSASKRLHEKAGFTLVKTEVNGAGNEMHRWEMEI